jgi:hypothetical protein
MLKLLTLVLILTFTGCSEHKETKSVTSSPSQKRAFPIYKRSDVLLALKYSLSASAIKDISQITKRRDIIRIEGDTAHRYTWSGDSDYVTQIRTLVDNFSTKYRISQATVANILIDRQILDVRETLPDDVAEEVVNRTTPETNGDE